MVVVYVQVIRIGNVIVFLVGILVVLLRTIIIKNWSNVGIEIQPGVIKVLQDIVVIVSTIWVADGIRYIVGGLVIDRIYVDRTEVLISRIIAISFGVIVITNGLNDVNDVGINT